MPTRPPGKQAIYDQIHAYVELVRSSGHLDGRDDVSEFWKEIFEARRNFPSFQEILHFRRGFSWPMADETGDPEAERRKAEAAYRVASADVPQRFLQGLRESPIGNPMTFRFGRVEASAGALTNAVTTYRVLDALRDAGLAGRRLRILEIGAGFGLAALQLIERAKVRSYAVCDLPENLFLSAFYLPSNLPRWPVSFVGPEGRTGASAARLTFLTPPFLEELKGPFDLILNSYSFQEMNRASVDTYFAYAAKHLAPDGILYSLNSHRKSGVEWPSDYPLGDFRLRRFRPARTFPFQVFATVPYELVLSPPRRPGDARGEDPALKAGLDGMGSLMQLGLHEELLPPCRALESSRRTPAESTWLQSASDFFRSRDPDEKRRAIESMRATRVADDIALFLEGIHAFARGEYDVAARLLADSERSLKTGHARIVAELALASLAYGRGDAAEGAQHEHAAAQRAPHLAEELRSLARRRSDIRHALAEKIYLARPTTLRSALGRASRTLLGGRFRKPLKESR